MAEENNANQYYSSVNQQLLDELPDNFSVVVEIGCGAGAFGAEYKKINPACKYIGIELVAEQAKIAEAKLDKVIIGHVAKIDFADLGLPAGQKVDCIVYGDVLEHLWEPW